MSHPTTEKSPNHYEILGVSCDATPEQIKRAYRRHMRSAHTDLAGEESHSQAAALNDAQSVLLDQARREDYDSQVGIRRKRHSHRATTRPVSTVQKAPSTMSSLDPDLRIARPLAPLNTTWSDSEGKESSLVRRILYAQLAAALIAAFYLYTVIREVFATPMTVPTLVAVAAMTIAVAAVASWIYFGKSLTTAKILAGVLVILVTGMPGSLGVLTAVLALALFATAILLWSLRADLHNFRTQRRKARRWEYVYNSCLLYEQPLSFIVQAVPIHHGRKTLIFVKNLEDGNLNNVSLWGAFRANTWITYDQDTETAWTWAPADCRDAWLALEDEHS